MKKLLYKIASKISKVFSGNKLSSATLEEIEDMLIMLDFGQKLSKDLSIKIVDARLKNNDIKYIKKNLAQYIVEIIEKKFKPLEIKNKTHIMVICGVNGNGKTTTVSKLAKQYMDRSVKVIVAACDTFRDAAVEQLALRCKKINCPLVYESKADPASIAYKATKQAIEEEYQLLIIDTAGRMHTNANLMDQLKKISNVVKKHDSTAPHDTILVLDGTTGQHAIQQIENFKSCVDINGLIVTKLDGSAKGGIVLRIASEYDLMFRAFGVGEAVEDLKYFSPDEFVNILLDIE